MAKGDQMTQSALARRKRTRCAALLICLVMPATIGVGLWLGQQQYMVVSVLLVFYTMLPFFLVFERRRPKAREIMLIAMMTALTVCAQLFFHMTIPVQIGTAMIILSGISLGPEAGFLIGAIARFVCNFYMGQGPWTPWQMFCWGILGFLAGLAFNKVDLEQLKSRQFKLVMGPVLCMIFALLAAWVSFQIWPGHETSFFGWRFYGFGAAGLVAGMLAQRKRLPVDSVTLVLFTFFVTFVVYGGIMNLWAMVHTSGLPDSSMRLSMTGLRTIYISGLPYDLFHAASAALCVFLFGNSIIRKLERIKIKYGIYK